MSEYYESYMENSNNLSSNGEYIKRGVNDKTSLDFVSEMKSHGKDKPVFTSAREGQDQLIKAIQQGENVQFDESGQFKLVEGKAPEGAFTHMQSSAGMGKKGPEQMGQGGPEQMGQRGSFEFVDGEPPIDILTEMQSFGDGESVPFEVSEGKSQLISALYKEKGQFSKKEKTNQEMGLKGSTPFSATIKMSSSKSSKNYKNSGEMKIYDESLDLMNNFSTSGSNKIASLIQNTDSSFTNLKKVKNFKNSFNRAERGYLEVSGTLNNSIKYLNDYYASLDNEEKKIIELVRGIDIPKEAQLNNFNVNFTQDAVNIAKNDGLSVNNGHFENAEKGLDEYKVAKTNLNNINNNNAQQNVNYDGRSIIKEEMLHNISKDGGLQFVESNNGTNIRQQKLQELVKNPDIRFAESDNNTNIKGQKLTNMSKGKDTQYVEEDFNPLIGDTMINQIFKDENFNKNLNSVIDKSGFVNMLNYNKVNDYNDNMKTPYYSNFIKYKGE